MVFRPGLAALPESVEKSDIVTIHFLLFLFLECIERPPQCVQSRIASASPRLSLTWADLPILYLTPLRFGRHLEFVDRSSCDTDGNLECGSLKFRALGVLVWLFFLCSRDVEVLSADCWTGHASRRELDLDRDLGCWAHPQNFASAKECDPEITLSVLTVPIRNTTLERAFEERTPSCKIDLASFHVVVISLDLASRRVSDVHCLVIQGPRHSIRDGHGFLDPVKAEILIQSKQYACAES